MEATEQREIEKRAFAMGMVIAAGIAAETDEVVASTILNCAGLTSFAELRAIGTEEYDLKKLCRVVASISAQNRAWDQRLDRGFARIDQLALAA